MRFIVATLALLVLNACGNGASIPAIYDTSSSAVIGAAVAGLASSSDIGGSVVSLNQPAASEKSVHLMAEHLVDILLEPKIYASTCATSAAVLGAGCTGAVMTLAMSGCSGLVGTWNGTYTLTFNSAAACTNATGSGLINMGAGNSVTITTTNASLSANSLTVSMSSASSGFSVAEGGGIQITCGGGGCASSRTVNILGVSRILSGNGTTLFNHTLSTPIAFTITGTGAAKQVTAGQLMLQHNLAHFIATSSINQSLTFSGNCCVPTGGSMTTTFSAGKSGSETVTFNPSCGSATVGSSSVTLNYCM